ncbi:MAG TPA: hypothetical protein VN224_13890 [Xanthomonadales bacterium]|nr:hypothetical protein [Xanthomonadales bacterium]
MGKEAVCLARVNGSAAQAKAHLDANELRLSGGHRLTVPLAQLTGVAADGDALRLALPDTSIELQLGAVAAQRWAHAIGNPKPRLEKLGVRGDERVCVRGIADESFLDELRGALANAPATSLRGAFDIIFQGVSRLGELAEVARGAEHLAPAGALWIVHPKGKGAAVGESDVRGAIARAGLYDAKVVAFSPIRTATKAAIRLKDRPKR